MASKNGKSNSVHQTIIKQARKSGQLNLSQRGLTTVPEEVWRINVDVPEEAQSVSMDSEDRWYDQVDLTKLILAANQIKAISDEGLGMLPALTVLDVHDNCLESLPESIGSLENLARLNISRNKLSVLPGCLGQLRNLASLHAENNSLTELPPQLGHLANLEDLDVSYNQLQELPHSLGYLNHLMKMNISNNLLAALPPELSSMTALRYLDANNNQLTRVPEDLGELQHLEQLYLRNNKLAYIPVLQNCKRLKELHLGNNALRGLTTEHLQHLASVSVLDLRDNKIEVLPDEITVLENLERLDLTNNDLSTLPFALGNIASLKAIVLDGNPMKSIRRDIIMRGTNQLKKYLQSRQEEVVEQPSNKGLAPPGAQSGMPGGDAGISAHEMSQFKSLDYSNKQAIAIPEDVIVAARDADVQSVNLSKNNFSQVPECLVLVEDLKELNMGFNRIAVLNADIVSLFLRLTALDLRNNMLSSLPAEIVSLLNLREIIISFNRFTSLPSVLYKLRKLEIIFANDNKIEAIDATGLLQLTALGTLDLRNNNISQLPPELGNCTWLRSVQLEGNCFRNPRPTILSKGTPALLEYLRGRIVA